MSRRFAFRPPPPEASLLGIQSTLRTWAPQLNEFVTPLGEQPQSWTDAGATPSARGGTFFEVTNSAPTSITDITDGRSGQNLVLKLDANTTVVHDATKIYLANQQDLIGGDGVVLSLWLASDGVWYQEGRPNVSAEMLYFARAIGNVTVSGKYATGGLGSSAWVAAFNRYAQVYSATNLAGLSAGAATFNTYWNPAEFLDPTYEAPGIVQRIENTVAMVPTLAAVGGYANACFGLLGHWSTATLFEDNPSITFYAYKPVGGSDPVWYCRVAMGGGGLVHVSQSTGITTLTPHLLTIILDGLNQQVRWYIDNALVYTWTPTAGQIPIMVAGTDDWMVRCGAAVYKGTVDLYYDMTPVAVLTERRAA